MKFIVLIALAFPLWVLAQSPAGFLPEKLAIDWQFVSNNYEEKEQFLATFQFSNQNLAAPLPAEGWTIYFNAVRDIANKDVGYGLEMERIHGDLFRLRPTAAFKGLDAKAQITLCCVSELWAFSKSDAPAGFYFVWDTEPSFTYPLANIRVLPPSDPAAFKRSKNQKNGQITPESVFEQNKNTTDLPESQLPVIFPTPVSCLKKDGFFEITAITGIAADPQFEKEALYLSETLGALLGSNLPIQPGATTNCIRLRFDPKQQNAEGYSLIVSPGLGVEIRASTPTGIFYGIQSLKNTVPVAAWRTPLPVLKIAAIEVQDAPRFAYRGLHVDIARNFQRKAEMLRILNWMAMYKLNTLHFHFSDDEGWRIEIPGLPELTTIGARRGHTLDSKNNLPATYGSGADSNTFQSGYYTRSDYIELLKYAKSLHIDVIPEIETPGHARAAIKAMEARHDRLMAENKPAAANEYLLSDPNDRSVYVSAQHFTDNVMCVALPSVYHFIEKVADELILMHQEAGMPLHTLHVGGDEVPQGVWEQSPLCQDLLKTLPRAQYVQTSDLWLYYWSKVQDIIAKRNLYVSGWEEIGLRETKLDGNKTMLVNPLFANNNFHTYVWNTVIGWGTEDLPYRLANGGYKVILCPVSNLYFDLSYQKDFEEPGYYWGGFLDLDKPYYFIPYNYLKNAKEDRFGNPIDPAVLVGKDRLTDFGKSNIVGIQGHLWSENIRSADDLEYLAFPKLLGLSERAWAADPAWATTKDPQKSADLYQKNWNEFVNIVGKRELPKLCYYQGGANFRIPTVGAKAENGAVRANIQLPGLVIRYTTDGTMPDANSAVYAKPIAAKGVIQFRAFDSRGRGGRSIQVKN